MDERADIEGEGGRVVLRLRWDMRLCIYDGTRQPVFTPAVGGLQEARDIHPM